MGFPHKYKKRHQDGLASMPFIESLEDSPLISVFENETSSVQGMADAYSRRFTQRMKVLEKRYSKFLALNGRVGKRILERDYQDALEISQELGNYPCFLGHVNEYPEEEWKDAEFPLFVHNRLIRTHAPSDLHEYMSNEIIHLIRSAFGRIDLRRFCADRGNGKIDLINFLGCHSRFNKQPDGQMSTTGPHAKRNGVHPFLTVEVSVFNEDWREMFFQAAAYLSEATGIQYHLMIFFDMQAENFNMSIILLERAKPPRFYHSEAEREEAFDRFVAQFAQAAQTELDPEPVAKRTRGQLRTRSVLCNKDAGNAWIRNARPSEIEDFFGFRIAFGVYIDESFFNVRDDGRATYIGPEFQLPFPITTIFEGSGINITQLLEEHRGQIVVALGRSFFGSAWVKYSRLRNRR